jgi:hypothetical protein
MRIGDLSCSTCGVREYYQGKLCEVCWTAREVAEFKRAVLGPLLRRGGWRDADNDLGREAEQS